MIGAPGENILPGGPNHLEISTVILLGAAAVGVNYVQYVPSVSLVLLALVNLGLIACAVLDRQKVFFALLLAMLVLVDQRSAVYYGAGSSPAFFGLYSEYPGVGISPLQVSIATAIGFVVIRLARGCNAWLLDWTLTSVLGILVVGGIVGLRNIPSGAKYYLSSIVPFVAFVAVLVLTRTRRYSERWWADLLTWLWALLAGKAAGYLILLLVGRFQITTAGNIRVFANSLFVPVVLVGVGMMLIQRRRNMKANFIKNYLLASVVLLSAAIQFALYFQRGQTIFFAAGVLFLGWISAKQFGRAVVRLTAVGVAILVLGGGIAIQKYDVVDRLAIGSMSEMVQEELRTLDQLNVLASGVESVRATEWRNIMARNGDTFAGAGIVLGQGFGGFYTDEPAEFPRRLSPADYTLEQRASEKFREPHSFFNVLLLSTGLTGLLLYGGFTTGVVAKCRRSALRRDGRGPESLLSPAWIVMPALVASLAVSSVSAMVLAILIAAVESS